MSEKSPYLKNGRLTDVLAVLQVMSIGERPEAEMDHWTSKLANATLEKDIDRWADVFTEHPEFFWVYTLETNPNKKAALRWRYASKLYDPITQTEYTPLQKAALPQPVQDKLTGKPLAPDAVNSLMKTAIELHSRAIAEETAKTWWMPLVPAALTFLASLVGAYIGAHK